MNKKITIFAVILIAIGIIGTISSAIAAVPFATNYINECAKKANEEVTIYEKKVNVDQLNVETKDITVEIKKSNSDKLKIVKVGTLNNDVLTVDNKEGIFEIRQNEKNKHIDMEVQGFGDAIINMIKLGQNKIIIYVPNNIDIQAKCRYRDLIVTDEEILNKKLSFETEYSQIILPKENKSLDNLTISSNGDINLKTSEILGIKNINISTTGGVYLQSMPNDVFIENIENYIPDTFNIIAIKYSPSITIESTVPIARKLNIDNKNGTTYLDLPIDRYNIEFNLAASENIYFEGEKDNNNESMKKFNGSLIQHQDNQDKYSVDVKSQQINIENN